MLVVRAVQLCCCAPYRCLCWLLWHGMPKQKGRSGVDLPAVGITSIIKHPLLRRRGMNRCSTCCGWISHSALRSRTACLFLNVQERDESVQRVLWVDLLNLLVLEGASGERVRAMLDASGVPAVCESV